MLEILFDDIFSDALGGLVTVVVILNVRVHVRSQKIENRIVHKFGEIIFEKKFLQLLS